MKTKYINLYALKIKEKYGLSDSLSHEYAIMDIDVLESHGGCIYDESSMESVISVVVASWIQGNND